MNSKSMKVTAGFAAVALMAILALPYLVDVDRFRPLLESRLASYLGREVHLGHMEWSLLAGGVRVEQISIADDPAFNNAPFLQAKSLGVGISWLSLIFSRSLHVTSLTLEQPHMTALQSEDGKWNFASLADARDDDPADALWTESVATSTSSFILDHLKISNATIELASAQSKGQRTALSNIDVDLKNVSLEKAVSFVFSARTQAGKLQLEGEAGPINRDNLDQTPFHARIKANKADLAQIASLSSASGLAGILNLDGTITSDGHTVHSDGKASAEKLRLLRNAQPASQTVSLRYHTDYLVGRKTGIVRNSEILAGRVSLTVSGTYSAPAENVIVHMKIAGDKVPLESLEGILPALGFALPGGSKLRGGTVTAYLSLDGPMNHLITSGTAQIAGSHFSGFDFGSKLSALPGLSAISSVGSDLAIINLSTHLRVAPEGTRISSFNGEFGGIGSITGDGDLSSTNHLQFKMVAHVAKDDAGRFVLNHVGLRKLPSDIPFQVVGTTSMPLIIPDLSGMAKNTTKTVATDTGRRVIKNLLPPQTNDPAPVQATNVKQSGFFRKLFRHKDKESNARDGVRLAAQKSAY